MSLPRRGPIPDQIEKILRDRILSKEYSPGIQLPSEDDLAEEFGISRGSVRPALAKLEADALIYRKQGDGTYVRVSPVQGVVRVTKYWFIKRWIENSGRIPTVKLISVKERLATEYEAVRLRIDDQTAVTELVHVFDADDQPIMFSTNVSPCSLLSTQFKDYEAEISIQEFLKRFCDQEIDHAACVIFAELSKPDHEKFLNLKPGSPLLRFEEVFFNINKLPLVFSINYINDNGFRLFVTNFTS